MSVVFTEVTWTWREVSLYRFLCLFTCQCWCWQRFINMITVAGLTFCSLFFLSPTHAISTTSFAFHCSGGGSYSRSLVHLRSIGIIHLECFVSPFFVSFLFCMVLCLCILYPRCCCCFLYFSRFCSFSFTFPGCAFFFLKGNESFFFCSFFPLICPLFLLQHFTPHCADTYSTWFVAVQVFAGLSTCACMSVFWDEGKLRRTNNKS